MLNYMHIENIAVIEQSDIEFSKGFNVLTGETGAGKSIIIDSINAVLGARTSKDLIRSGCNSAKVIAEFSYLSDYAVNEVIRQGYSLDDDNKLVLQRIISADSKGGYRINGQPASGSSVREIGKYLINIHGQHDNQRLLNPENHCAYIDKLADNKSLYEDYYDEFKRINSIRSELKSLEMDDDEKARRIDYLKYAIKEIVDADIKVGEYSLLKDKLKIAQSFEKTYSNVTSAYETVGGANGESALYMLKSALKNLKDIELPEVKNIYNKLSDIVENLNDVDAELRNCVEFTLKDDINIDQISERLDTVSGIMLKYGGCEEKVIESLTNYRNELENINFSDKRTEELENQLLISQDLLIKKGKKLTDSRKTAAEIFEKNVTDILSFLDMPSAKFKVKTEQGRYTKNGCDNIEFLISANTGEEVKPLVKIASGGELSRVMLAIKSALTDKDEVDTLIFDEIDSGISGHAAQKVAHQLKKVSKNCQVICVTHLAQIAAYAENHMLIKKSVKADRTFTNVTSLDYEGRIEEISRIMSGTEMTKNMYNSAKELLDRGVDDNENL